MLHPPASTPLQSKTPKAPDTSPSAAGTEHLWEGAYGSADVKKQRELRLQALQQSKWQEDIERARKESKFPKLHGLYRHRHDDKGTPRQISGYHPLLPELLAQEQKEKVLAKASANIM